MTGLWVHGWRLLVLMALAAIALGLAVGTFIDGVHDGRTVLALALLVTAGGLLWRWSK